MINSTIYFDIINMNLKQILETTALEIPRKTALVHGSQRFTYQELEEQSNRVANLLVELGIKKHDHVAILMSHSPQWCINYFGIVKSGAVAILLSPVLKYPEIISLVRDSNASVIITERSSGTAIANMMGDIPNLKHVLEVDESDYQLMTSNASHQAPQVPIDEDDIATIIYTSGVLGKQKGVVHTHSSLLGTPEIVSDGLRRTMDDVIIDPVPFFYLLGLSELLLGSIIRGSTVVIVPQFTPRAILRAIEREKGSILFGVPAMYNTLAMLPERVIADYEIASLRVATSAGAKSSPRLMKMMEEKLNLTYCETYGLSELSVVSMSSLDNHRIGTVGKPICEIKVMDDNGNDVTTSGQIGEAVVRAPWMMQGYYNAPDLTTQVIKSGWFYTGDLIRMDGDGYLEYVEKKSFIIVTASGLKISPWEVEEVLLSHKSIAEAAFVGVGQYPDNVVPTAFIVPEDSQTITTDEVASFCREKLADFKLPRRYVFVDGIPRTGSGKIKRQKLRETLL